MSHRTTILTIALLLLVGSAPAMGTDTETGFSALHRLDIPKARASFEAALKTSPSDIAAMRGLLLAAYFDLDEVTEETMVRALAAAGPSSPYLQPVLEHVAAEMVEMSCKKPLERLLGEVMIGSTDGAVRYNGRRILSSISGSMLDSTIMNNRESLGKVPGGWVTGPFDNRSNIAAYRAVPWEHELLDTTAVTDGKNGVKAAWTWQDENDLIDFLPYVVIGVDSNIACQFRTFFSIPQEQEILILPGGAFCGRLYVDGARVQDDPIYRNANQREGVRVRLGAGAHEIRAIFGSENNVLGFSLAVVDTSYGEIAGLQWLRMAKVPSLDTLPAEPINPLFDPFERAVAAQGDESDSHFWRGVLYIDNGYAPEVIRGFEWQASEGKLTLLETWVLYRALKYHQEQAEAARVLETIHGQASPPAVALEWTLTQGAGPEERVRLADSLTGVFPGRAMLDAMAVVKYLFKMDYKQFESEMTRLKAKYPGYCGFSKVLISFQARGMQNQEAAYREFTAYCEQCQEQRQRLVESPLMLARLGRYREAFDTALLALRLGADAGIGLENLVTIAQQGHLWSDFIEVVDSMRHRYPWNAIYCAHLKVAYEALGDFDNAKRMWTALHAVKPTAVRPYLALDSLHHNVSYDSLFGDMDVMSLWDVTPTPHEIGRQDYWELLNRVQMLVFPTGMVYRDVHSAWVVLNKDQVQQSQDVSLSFAPSDGGLDRLLKARRLRKGQPPVDAQINGAHAIFQDLQPGDAVELRYRLWSGNSGDLWHSYWSTRAYDDESYRRFWEYTVLTDRDDLRYEVTSPASKPEVTTRYGYRKITWKGEKVPARRRDASSLPSFEQVLGTINITTIKDWEALRQWYRAVSDAVLGYNPRTDDLGRELVEGLTDEHAKLEALYRFVVLEIPYQVIDFNYDGSIPHSPDDVLLNGWGDCKDKAHLLIAMLRAAGIRAWPTLVKTWSEGQILPIPMFNFDHLIVTCVVDGDTVSVDPSDAGMSPWSSITTSIGDQPCLQVDDQPSRGITRLPVVPSERYQTRLVLTLGTADSGGFAFSCERSSFRATAGNRRDEFRGKSDAELVVAIGSDYSDYWGTGVVLDSVWHDTCESVDTVFRERWHGHLGLSVKRIGKTTMLSQPAWSYFRESLPADLTMEGSAAYPVNLRNLTGTSLRQLEMTVPESYGDLQVPDPVTIADSLYSFSSVTSWDKASRKLTVRHDLRVEWGLTDRKRFASDAARIVEAYHAPLLFIK